MEWISPGQFIEFVAWRQVLGLRNCIVGLKPVAKNFNPMIEL